MGTKWNSFTNNFDLVNSTDGLVVGPAISTDNAVARFDGTTGVLLQNSGTTLSDADLLSTGEINLTTDLAVTHGGTGRGTGTAYSVVCSGTTATGAQQSVADVGTNGQVLTSGGAATLPTWTSVAGTGDVTAAAALTDNSLIRGNGGAKGVQDSGILIDDSDNLNIPTGGVLQVNAVETLSATTLGAAVVGSSLTSVGTLTSGVWNGTAILDEYGGTGQSTWTKGDILYASAANVLSKLAVGADNEVLVVNVDVPNWEAQAGGGDVSKVGTPVDSQVGVWTGDGTIEGDAAFTFDTSTDTLAVAASGKFNFGAVTILSDSAGTMTLSNVDAIDATTETTLESAIDSLANLTVVGTIVTGVWNGTDIAVADGGTGASSLLDNAVLIGSGTGAITALTVGTDGQLLVGSSAADPVFATISSSDSTIEFTTGAGTLTIQGAAATATQAGVIEMATDAETNTGTAVDRALTPANITAWTGDTALVTTGTITTGTWTATDIAAADGGTGRSSHTAYAVLCGGTTTTASQQSIASVGTSGQVLTSNGAAALPTFQAAGASAMADFVVQWSAASLDPLETSFSPLEKITTTSIIQKVRSHAYDTIEYSNGVFEVPPDMNTTGTITFSVQWFARTVPAGSENVIWQIEHAAVATTEDLDSASYTAEVAAASATGTTQNALVRATWTETRANLGWVAGDTVYVKWSRKSTDALDTFDTAATTADDALLVNATIIIPQA